MSTLVSGIAPVATHKTAANGTPAAAPAMPNVQLNQADPILLWNAVALEANRVTHTNGVGEQAGPPLSARALAIVHLAMYDAYAKVVGNPTELPAYLPGLPDPNLGAAADLQVEAAAAVAGAAYKTLVTLFPSQTAFFDLVLNAVGDPSPARRTFGEVVAQRILDARNGDPGTETLGYKLSKARFHHRADPNNPGQVVHAPFYGAKARGFAITNRHFIMEPPQGGPQYEAALREVRARGIAPELMATLPPGVAGRTANETLRGIFWGYDGAAKLGTPPRFFNQIVRRIAIARNNTPAQNARLFALVNVAMADAGMLAWDWKYVYDFWRPVVGVREHDVCMGPSTTVGSNTVSSDCDSAWLPLGAPATNSTGKNFTPPFPAYPSGHATFGAASLHMVRLFYGVPVGDRNPDHCFQDANGAGLNIVSEEFNGVNQDNHGAVRPRHVRSFPDGLWQMIVENGLSRVDLGVHWVFDAFAVTQDAQGNQVPDLTQPIGGVWLGLAIAEDIWQTHMHPSPVGPRSEEAIGSNWRTAVPYVPQGE
ncbi:MAG: hypothetical protein IPK16_09970 [Anaerolineales bacterium]|nr:hypothetical protein [Anaerolineales bacterium]